MSSYSAVWLYGSTARQDSDRFSDIDLLFVDSKRRQPTGEDRPSAISLSSYSWTGIEGMAAYGSLFLVHLGNEGVPLHEGEAVRGRLAGLVKSMLPYQRARDDAKSFRITLMDVAESIANGGSVPFELSVVGTLVRNMSILGCYLSGTPNFGRTSAITRFAELADLSADDTSALLDCYSFQLHATKGAPAPAVPDTARVISLLNLVSRLVCSIEVMAHEL